jgi:hypothetical protein
VLLQALDDQTEVAQIRPRHNRLPLIACHHLRVYAIPSVARTKAA